MVIAIALYIIQIHNTNAGHKHGYRVRARGEQQGYAVVGWAVGWVLVRWRAERRGWAVV